MIKIAVDNNLAIEFSSSFSYNENAEIQYCNADIKRMPHNYFPAPKVPFVLNLASKNPNLRRLSVDHCKNGLRLAKHSRSPFFAAHAGFCVDPAPQDLGRIIHSDSSLDKDYYWELFCDSIRDILDMADVLEIDFLIENNVLAPFNYLSNFNPFFCCESIEVTRLMMSVQHPRLGLLLDTAHLKVSCNTLSLNLDEECIRLYPFIKGVHHSDNNSLEDNNMPIADNYWFLKHLAHFKNYAQVVEVKHLDLQMIKDQCNILTNIIN